LSFTACSSDDNEGTAPDSLVGTTWRFDFDPSFEELRFTTSSQVTIYQEDVIITSDTYTYEYDAPDIIIYRESDTPLEGTVRGNKLTLYWPDYYDEELFYEIVYTLKSE
jgi:hypothetical protein